jgi:hypothetical protein
MAQGENETMKAMFLACCLSVASLHAQNTLKTTTIDRYFNYVRQFLESAAESMPAEKYNFRLTPAQMTFGEWINHSTERNYLDCSTLRGEPNPMPKSKTDLLKGKGEIIEHLKDSFTYCVTTFDKLDDQKILSSPQMTASFLHIIVHNNEIYGNVVGYLRVSGIVPPSTELMNKMLQRKK